MYCLCGASTELAGQAEALCWPELGRLGGSRAQRCWELPDPESECLLLLRMADAASGASARLPDHCVWACKQHSPQRKALWETEACATPCGLHIEEGQLLLMCDTPRKSLLAGASVISLLNTLISPGWCANSPAALIRFLPVACCWPVSGLARWGPDVAETVLHWQLLQAGVPAVAAAARASIPQRPEAGCRPLRKGLSGVRALGGLAVP